jgi:hypothetical protein
MIQSVKAKETPPPLCQRVQPVWDWEGVKIQPNAQCMDCLFHDVMVVISKEFNIPTLNPGSVRNYMAIFLGTFKAIFGKAPARHHYFDTSFHCIVINEILKKNGIPIKVKRQSTKNLRYAIEKLHITKRFIGLSINSAVGRHMIGGMEHDNQDVEVADYYGEEPYKKVKNGGHFVYTMEHLGRLGINSVIWIEDVKNA